MTTEPAGEAEQPLLTPEEVMENLAVRNARDAETDTIAKGSEIFELCPTKGVDATAEEKPVEREVMVVTDEGAAAEQGLPREESAEPSPAPVRTYRRRSAREETSGKESTGKLPKEIPTRNTEKGVDGPARSGMTTPRRRRKLIIVDETEEEEDVIFTPLDALTPPPANAKCSEEKRKERKRKGKAIASPVKKRMRKSSSTLVIQEERQRTEEVGDDEESLRTERRTKCRNDRARAMSEKRPDMARIQIGKWQVRLDSDLLRRMITFDNPESTTECAARIKRGKKVRSGRRLSMDALGLLEATEGFLKFITGIGFNWLSEPSSPQMPLELARVFYHFPLHLLD